MTFSGRGWCCRSGDNSRSFGRISFILFALQSEMIWLQRKPPILSFCSKHFFPVWFQFYTFWRVSKNKEYHTLKHRFEVYIVVRSFLVVMRQKWTRSDQNCSSYRRNGNAGVEERNFSLEITVERIHDNQHSNVTKTPRKDSLWSVLLFVHKFITTSW